MKLNLLILVIIAATLLVPLSHAGVIVDSTVSGSPGAFSYSYQIENQTAVGIFSFSLTVTGDVGAVLSPNGWVVATGIPSPGETLVQWVDLDVPFDVLPFSTLSGFGITSVSDPGAIASAALDENFIEFDGQTTGPVAMAAATPEPNTFIIVAVVVAGMWAYRNRRCSVS